jgi:predicted ATPase/class 3 adenylate cyclase
MKSGESMPEQIPRKLLAIMFTDIAGFTAIMQEDEDLGLQKRKRFKEVLDEQHGAYRGEIVQYFGDGTLSTFSNAVDAVLCAIEIQREFGKPLEVPLRIGIHAGNVVSQPDGIIGDAVNVASRIESFSVPGAILVSDSVHDQIMNQSQIHSASLGKYRLKNVARPYEIFAISTEGITVPNPSDLKGKGAKLAILRSTIPAPATPLLGREKEIEELIDLIEDNSIVTITGPGGMGKTRIALELCHRLSDEFPDGIAFVSMASITEASEFIPTLASALDIREAEGRELFDGLTLLIGDKDVLLAIDNLEQIISAAPVIAELVARSPDLKIITTSRTPLRISAEREYALLPLPLPAQEDLGSIADLATYSAIALFTERANKANSTFDLNRENASDVVEICRRLDGLPLALELAAARIRILSPKLLLKRLGRALDVLTSGARDLPKRQQTLRATIDWSHSLLDESATILFRRLAVFSGGFTLDAVEATCCDEDPGFFLDELESLIDKGLVQSIDGGERFTMLQTIREYALEKLEAAGEQDEIKLNHARYYTEISKGINKGTQGEDQLAWINRGALEDANIQSALHWLLDQSENEHEELVELGLRICGELWLYWHFRGINISARDWVDSFLNAVTGDHDSLGKCLALRTAGLCSWTLGQFSRSVEEYQGSYDIALALDMEFEMAVTAFCFALSHMALGEMKMATRYSREAVDLSRKLGHEWSLGMALTFNGVLSLLNGDPAMAKDRYVEALNIQRLADWLNWHLSKITIRKQLNCIRSL